MITLNVQCLKFDHISHVSTFIDTLSHVKRMGIWMVYVIRYHTNNVTEWL
jgi:hypothetical protein